MGARSQPAGGGMSAPARVSRALLRLSHPGAVLAPLGAEADGFGVFPAGDRRRRPLARLGRADVRALESAGAIARTDGDAYAITADGRARTRRHAQAPGEDGFQAQHRVHMAQPTPDDKGGVETLTVNRAETPLMWLMRRSRDGKRFVTEREFVAAQRLRADFEHIHRAARVTMDWSGAPRQNQRRGPVGGPMMGQNGPARARFEAALSVLGPGLDQVVRSVCCEERGLDAVERALGWPRRSAKVALKLGLSRLADHYQLP